jgi:hypothetical protein
MLKVHKFLLAACAVGAFAAFLLAADSAPVSPQPVLVLLYSRYYDHSHPDLISTRLNRLLPQVERLSRQYPGARPSVLLQFSGTVAQLLHENQAMRFPEKIKALQARKLIEVGYTGEDEPSYLNRPKPDILVPDTPEARWTARAEAAAKFLNDFKDPVTGESVPGLSGGLKRVQEIFGPVAFISGANPNRMASGGDSAIVHEVRRLNDSAVLTGIGPADVRRGIEGYSTSAPSFSQMMSPEPSTSPEVYWADGFLRLSSTSLRDNKPITTDETPEAMASIFSKLDRKRVRVIRLEIGGYLRYMTKRSDGSVLYDPMEWLYFHPDEPHIPFTMKPFVEPLTVEKGYRNEEAVLRWLCETFFPENPGSRFVSINDLKQMTDDPESAQVAPERLRAIANDLDRQYSARSNEVANFVTADGRYFSLAEAFTALAEGLARMNADPTPAPVHVGFVYGPLETLDKAGPMKVSVKVSEVMEAAAAIALKLRSQTWQTAPSNALPAVVDFGTARVNTAQMLRLMTLAYLNPDRDKTLTIGSIMMYSPAAFMFPKNTAISDSGAGWTYKPAPLRLSSASAPGAVE